MSGHFFLIRKDIMEADFRLTLLALKHFSGGDLSASDKEWMELLPTGKPDAVA